MVIIIVLGLIMACIGGVLLGKIIKEVFHN